MDENKLTEVYAKNKREIMDIFDKYDFEWRERIRKNEEEGAPMPTVEDLYELKMGQCDELIEQIRQHQRLIKWVATGQIEPMTHYAHAVVTGRVGAG